jgi:hypothetical protein
LVQTLENCLMPAVESQSRSYQTRCQLFRVLPDFGLFTSSDPGGWFIP